jgi:hypothetical protein
VIPTTNRNHPFRLVLLACSVVVIPPVIFRLMASAFASASPDALMPLPSREAAAPFGQRQSRSLPHTLPGVWFVPFGTVLAIEGQATPCPRHSAVGKRWRLVGANFGRLPRRIPAAWLSTGDFFPPSHFPTVGHLFRLSPYVEIRA